MIYPSFLKAGDKVGICAPSAGCKDERDILRTQKAIENLKKYGLEVVVGENVYKNKPYKYRSNNAELRAKEFTKMWLDKDIKAIFAISGGIYEVEILPYLDWDLLRTVPPKYFQGFSDNTNLVLAITENLDVCSIYGANFKSFGTKDLHKSICYNLDFLMGKNKTLNSYSFYEKESLDDETNPYTNINDIEPTHPKILSPHKSLDITGRLVGGCLDSVARLCGTPYAVKNFLEKYKEEGIIWYLEACDLPVCEQEYALWQLKNNGYFDHTIAIIIGRPLIKEDCFEINYLEANYGQLKDLNIPVLMDMDFGHTSPKIHILNGACANIKFENNSYTIDYILK